MQEYSRLFSGIEQVTQDDAEQPQNGAKRSCRQKRNQHRIGKELPAKYRTDSSRNHTGDYHKYPTVGNHNNMSCKAAFQADILTALQRIPVIHRQLIIHRNPINGADTLLRDIFRVL